MPILRFLTPLLGGVSVTIKARYYMNAAYDFCNHARHTNEPCVMIDYTDDNITTPHVESRPEATLGQGDEAQA